MFITGARELEISAKEAQRHGVKVIYTGHGGDALFCKNLLSETVQIVEPHSTYFDHRIRGRFRKVKKNIASSEWRKRDTALFLHSGHEDIWLKKNFGATPRSIFTDLSFLKAAWQWSEYCDINHKPNNKSILLEAFEREIPIEVTQRKGKVDFVGVWARAYDRNADNIFKSISIQSDLLDKVGFKVPSILRKLSDLQKGKTDGAQEVSSAYCVARWLEFQMLI